MWRRPVASAATMTTQCRREHKRLPERCGVYAVLCDRYAYPCLKYFVENRRADLLNDIAFWRACCLTYAQEPSEALAKSIVEKFLVAGAPREVRVQAVDGPERKRATEDALSPAPDSTVFADLCEAVLDELAGAVYTDFLVEFPNFVNALQLASTSAAVVSAAAAAAESIAADVPPPSTPPPPPQRVNSGVAAVQVASWMRRPSTCNIAFGVRRGACSQPGCDCHGYRFASSSASSDTGGPCLNCGHVPTNHANLGNSSSTEDIPPPPIPLGNAPAAAATGSPQVHSQPPPPIDFDDIPPPSGPPPPLGPPPLGTSSHPGRTLSQDITSDRPRIHTPSYSSSGQASPLVPRKRVSPRSETPSDTGSPHTSSPIVPSLLAESAQGSRQRTHTGPGAQQSVPPPPSPQQQPIPPPQAALPSTPSTIAANVEKLAADAGGAQWVLDKSELRMDSTPIGSGRSATVFRGRWRNQDVAVKVLKEESETKTVEDFKLELQFLSSLRSPHFVYFYGVVLDPPRMCLLLEWCARGSLFGFMQKTEVNFTWDLFFKFALEATQGLSALHNWKPQIVHRDFKSHNLLITENWQLKISDFGLSRFLVSNAETLQKVRGTYVYNCPEVFFGRPCTDKSDVFSLGIVLWEMMMRCMKGEYVRPYSHTSIPHDFQIFIHVSKLNLRPFIPTNCPTEIASLLKICWDASPDIRPTASSAQQTLLSLESLYKTKHSKKWDKVREKKKH